MLRGNKNIKDTTTNLNPTLKDTHPSVSYTKSNKLVTALYMVTDIMDKEEPLRGKLRTLGTQIISDIFSAPINASNKILEILSFLEIASAVSLVSTMNFSILKKEFLELEKAIRDYGKVRSLWLEETILKPEEFLIDNLAPKEDFSKRTNKNSIGHRQPSGMSLLRTRIGVQKGSTLMQALSDKASHLYNKQDTYNNFDILKRQRRSDIVRVLRTHNEGFTITDIKTKARELEVKAESIISCGEKTLQRELISMVKDGVLNKVGEKRWSKYFIS